MAALPGANNYENAHAVNLLDTQAIRFLRDPVTQDAIVEVDSHWQTRLLKGTGLRPAASWAGSRRWRS